MTLDALLRALGQEKQLFDRHARFGGFELGHGGRIVAAQEALIAPGVESARLAGMCLLQLGQHPVCILEAPLVVQSDDRL